MIQEKDVGKDVGRAEVLLTNRECLRIMDGKRFSETMKDGGAAVEV